MRSGLDGRVLEAEGVAAGLAQLCCQSRSAGTADFDLWIGQSWSVWINLEPGILPHKGLQEEKQGKVSVMHSSADTALPLNAT